MEEFKEYSELTKIDNRYLSLAQLTGTIPDLKKIHSALGEIHLNSEVPTDIKSQFNVARNMALYSYFLYSLVPEVQLKSYTIIEYALRLKAEKEGVNKNAKRPLMLRKLLDLAVKQGWVKDSGFRHINDPSSSNDWCKSMVHTISDLRNSQAHGSTMLTPDFYHHICVCADFINQLFPGKAST